MMLELIRGKFLLKLTINVVKIYPELTLKLIAEN
jgi:hypothetical protein